jgi:DeoR/GlpR family transcriptional regulator of sugar metabolism
MLLATGQRSIANSDFCLILTNRACLCMMMPNGVGSIDMAAPDLLLHERQTLILERLRGDGRVIAATIARELSISEDTIRRDLRELAAAGLCRRVYGGALPANDEPTTLAVRLTLTPERKAALARASAPYFEPGMTVFIDSGSTNLAIARALPLGLRATVITNTPVIAAALADRSEIDVVMLGGKLDHRTGAVIGARAIAEAQGLRPDLCVLGSCGFDAEAGISADDFDEAEFKRAIARRSRAVLVAITNEKLGVPAPFEVVALRPSDHIVLEHDADPGQRDALARSGMHAILADPVPS